MKTTKFLGTIKPNEIKEFDGVANELILGFAGPNQRAFGRQRLTKEPQQGFKIQDENNAEKFSLRIAPKIKQ